MWIIIDDHKGMCFSASTNPIDFIDIEHSYKSYKQQNLTKFSILCNNWFSFNKNYANKIAMAT